MKCIIENVENDGTVTGIKLMIVHVYEGSLLILGLKTFVPCDEYDHRLARWLFSTYSSIPSRMRLPNTLGKHGRPSF